MNIISYDELLTSKEKFNPFEEYADKKIKKLQVAFLREHIHLSYQEIAEYIKMSASTACRWFHDFEENIFKIAKKIFKAITTAVSKRTYKHDTRTTWNCKKPQNDNESVAYVIEFYDSDKNFAFTKIGKSNRVERRVKEELNEYKKTIGEGFALIKNIFCFGTDIESEDNALTMENHLRKYLKIKGTKKGCYDFVKNDRFTKQVLTEKDYNLLKKYADELKESEIEIAED